MINQPQSEGMTGSSEAKVWLEDVTKHYGLVVALAEIDLKVISGEFLTILGPSRFRQDDGSQPDRRHGGADGGAQYGSTEPTPPACRPASGASAWCSRTTP